MSQMENSPSVGGGDFKPRRSFMEILTLPAVDRAIAILAVSPFLYVVYVRYGVESNNLVNYPNVAGGLATLVFISTMFIRRPPVRVTPNPLYWLLAFVATYGMLAPYAFEQPGVSLAPSYVTNTIASLSVTIALYARFSLGRNIGFVPAQRKLVNFGAYRFVRHPIYSGVFLGYVAAGLENYTPSYVAMAGTISLLFVIKSFVEEDFLRQDPEYAEYMKKVRYRWFPGIA
jgi:protein-S-isoprenylcysteine O-methyltransferase Ste14